MLTDAGDAPRQVNLENFSADHTGMSEGETDMTKRERERVQIGTDAAGKPVYTWVEGKNRQDFLIKAAQTLLAYGMLDGCKPEQQEKAPQTPTFWQYAEQWWELYKLPKLRHTTRTTYRNLLDTQLGAILLPERKERGFVLGDGEKPLTERTFTRLWQRIGRKIDLHDATPHIFRHTYITMAASSGIDVKTLQEIAGHSDIKMTMERYAHAREEKVMQAGAMIGNVFKAG